MKNENSQPCNECNHHTITTEVAHTVTMDDYRLHKGELRYLYASDRSIPSDDVKAIDNALRRDVKAGKVIARLRLEGTEEGKLLTHMLRLAVYQELVKEVYQQVLRRSTLTVSCANVHLSFVASGR